MIFFKWSYKFKCSNPLILIFRKELKPAFFFYKSWGEQGCRAVVNLERVEWSFGCLCLGNKPVEILNQMGLQRSVTVVSPRTTSCAVTMWLGSFSPQVNAEMRMNFLGKAVAIHVFHVGPSLAILAKGWWSSYKQGSCIVGYLLLFCVRPTTATVKDTYCSGSLKCITTCKHVS